HTGPRFPTRRSSDLAGDADQRHGQEELGHRRAMLDSPAVPDKTSYRDAGVDIDAQDEALREVRRIARGTFTPNVISDIGSFGGLNRKSTRLNSSHLG